MERVNPSEQGQTKETWTEADIASFLQKIASYRQLRIKDYGADFMKYIAQNRLQRFKRRITSDPIFFRAVRYWSYSDPPTSSQLPSKVIAFGPKWKSEVEAILSGISVDKNEVAIFVGYNLQTKTFGFKRGPIGSSGEIDITKSIVQTEIVDQNPVVVTGHTHPLPEHVYKRSLHYYGHPTNTAFFSPGDLDNITHAMITPFHFVISGDRMSVAITTLETRSGDIEDGFIKTRVGIPEGAFEVEKIQDALRATYYHLKLFSSEPSDEFDMFEWNIEMAKKYGFALYQGSMETVERVA